MLEGTNSGFFISYKLYKPQVGDMLNLNAAKALMQSINPTRTSTYIPVWFAQKPWLWNKYILTIYQKTTFENPILPSKAFLEKIRLDYTAIVGGTEKGMKLVKAILDESIFSDIDYLGFVPLEKSPSTLSKPRHK